MYRLFKGLALGLMKAPADPPEPPAGSHESVQVFRASPKYLTYRMLGYWFIVGLLWTGWWILVGVAVAGIRYHSQFRPLESRLI